MAQAKAKASTNYVGKRVMKELGFTRVKTTDGQRIYCADEDAECKTCAKLGRWCHVEEMTYAEGRIMRLSCLPCRKGRKKCNRQTRKGDKKNSIPIPIPEWRSNVTGDERPRSATPIQHRQQTEAREPEVKEGPASKNRKRKVLTSDAERNNEESSSHRKTRRSTAEEDKERVAGQTILPDGHSFDFHEHDQTSDEIDELATKQTPNVKWSRTERESRTEHHSGLQPVPSTSAPRDSPATTSNNKLLSSRATVEHFKEGLRRPNLNTGARPIRDWPLLSLKDETEASERDTMRVLGLKLVGRHSKWGQVFKPDELLACNKNPESPIFALQQQTDAIFRHMGCQRCRDDKEWCGMYGLDFERVELDPHSGQQALWVSPNQAREAMQVLEERGIRVVQRVDPPTRDTMPSWQPLDPDWHATARRAAS